MCPNFVYSWQSSLSLVFIGAAMGARGTSAAMLVLPVFLLALGLPLELAVPATAAVAGIAALSGAYETWSQKRLEPRGLLGPALAAVPSAIFLAWVSRWIPSKFLLSGFLAVLVLAGALVWWPGRMPSAVPLLGNRPRWVPLAVLWGAMTGLFGAAGGWFAVNPEDRERYDRNDLSLGLLAASALASLLVWVPSGSFRWTVVAPALVATLAGMEIGGWIAPKVNPRVMDRVVAVGMFGAAILLVVLGKVC